MRHGHHTEGERPAHAFDDISTRLPVPAGRGIHIAIELNIFLQQGSVRRVQTGRGQTYIAEVLRRDLLLVESIEFILGAIRVASAPDPCTLVSERVCQQ